MKHTTVKSSMVRSYGYDLPTKTLELTFHDGTTYAYDDVPSAVPQAISKTPSIGAYLKSRIILKYKARKLEPLSSEEDTA